MDKTINVSQFISIASLCIAVLSGINTIAMAYANSAKRKLAQERDLNHFKGSLAQAQQSLDFILKEMDERFDEVDKNLIVLISDSRNSRINIKEQ